MAHFAELDENNVVVYVTVGKDDDDENELSERTGKKYKKCSYNTHCGTHALGGTPFRKNFPGIGYVYDEERDAFISPIFGTNIPKIGEQSENSCYKLNEETCQWEIAIPKPEGVPYPDAVEGEPNEWYWEPETSQWLGFKEWYNIRNKIVPITKPKWED